MHATRIDHINLCIPKDGVEEALEFYSTVLGFEPMKLDEFRENKRTSFFFRISKDAVINIRPKENFQKPSEENFDHFCIIFDEKIEHMKSVLEESEAEILKEGNPLGAKGRGPGIYIRDPFGYKIELKAEK